MKTWSYYVNPFLLCGLMSYKKAVKISTFTDEKMAGQLSDPFIAAQYAIYHPLHLALVAAYNAWVANGGTQKGSTALLDLLFTQLTALVNAWDGATVQHYAKGSPQYIAIWPKGHSDFNRGSIDQRIGAIDSLATRLTPYTLLAAVKTAVLAEHVTLDEARTAQLGDMGITGTAGHTVEHAVNAAMVGMFAFYGAGINAYPSDPAHIAPFFDESTVRNPQQTEFTNHCPPGTHKNIFKRTLPPTTIIRTTNTGTNDVYVFFAATKGANASADTAVRIAPGSFFQGTATEYGYIDDGSKPYFNVTNPDMVNASHFTIEIL